jgi:ATP-dependent DNA helicase RecG
MIGRMEPRPDRILDLATPLRYLQGIGPARAEKLGAEGLATIEDLLLHLPFRYEDRSCFLPITALLPGVRGTVRGRVLSAALRRTRQRRLTIFEALVEDDSGSVRVLFYNQPYLRTLFTTGREVILYGETTIARRGRSLILQSPQFEVLGDDDEAIHTGRIVPIYPRLPGFSSRAIRRIMHRALHLLPAVLPDPLPAGVAARRRFPPRRQALCEVHFPPPDTDPEAMLRRRAPAQHRLIFEEFFFLQLGFALARREVDAASSGRAALHVDDAVRARLRAVLPFRLTGAQKKALGEIAADLMSGRPMNRLLQGDVGCGKTMVALLAALLAVENGHQAAFMAPTEILAEQHHRSFRRLLEGRGYQVGLLTSGVRGPARRQLLNGLRSGDIPFVVGTHALGEEGVRFRSLRLAIIDEQHRFGVAQRARVRAKGDRCDVLVMTATPIPRSLALTVYGDLDLSVIDELPPGRKPVRTVMRGDEARSGVYDFLRARVAEGRQVYVVYPVIEESERGDLRAAAAMAERLRVVFPAIPIGLLHGRLKAEERDEVMGRFLAGAMPILVSTTVIEVGIDVPNATVMVIEQAERFGLSQLHQLRGRVGRGEHESYCILMAGVEISDEGRRRLEVMCRTSDGFEIARRDLEMRGPGHFFGTRQSGIPDLRLGDVLRDHDILEDARREAFAAAAALQRSGHRDALLQHLTKRWSRRLGMIEIG